MRKKSQRFQAVIRVAQSKEDKAADLLRESQQHLQQQRQRLADLQNFLEEYSQGFIQSGNRGGFKAGLVTSYQSFLAKVDQAVKEQTRMVAVAEQLAEEKRQLWLLSRNDKKLVDGVMDKYLAQERQWQDKQEQKETDERGQRLINQLLGLK